MNDGGMNSIVEEVEAAEAELASARAAFEAARARHRKALKLREVEILREFDSGLINKPHVDGPKRFNVSAAAVYNILKRNDRDLKKRGTPKEAAA